MAPSLENKRVSNYIEWFAEEQDWNVCGFWDPYLAIYYRRSIVSTKKRADELASAFKNRAENLNRLWREAKAGNEVARNKLQQYLERSKIVGRRYPKNFFYSPKEIVGYEITS